MAKEIVKNIVELTDRKSLEKFLTQKKSIFSFNSQESPTQPLLNGLQNTIEHLAQMGIIKEANSKQELSEYYDTRRGLSKVETPKITDERGGFVQGWSELEDLDQLGTDKPISDNRKETSPEKQVETPNLHSNNLVQADLESSEPIIPSQTKRSGLSEKQLTFFARYDKQLEQLINHPNFDEIFTDEAMKAFIKKQVKKVEEIVPKKASSDADDEFCDLFDQEFLAAITRDEMPQTMISNGENEKLFLKQDLRNVEEAAAEAEEDFRRISYEHAAKKIITKETMEGQLAGLFMGTNIEEL